jgi:hypothetical protein
VLYPTDGEFCHDLPVEQARYFSKKTREVLAINPGSFGNRAIINIPTPRTELLGSCKQLKWPFGPIRIELPASKLSLEARVYVHDRLVLTLSSSGIGLAFRK